MSHRFFSLPSSGGQELHCILCKWQPLELCTHNLYIHGWGHWSTSVLSLLAPKWTLAWSTKSTDFILSAIDALSHMSLAHLSSPVAMINSPWQYTDSGITVSSASTWVFSSVPQELCRHDQDMWGEECPSLCSDGEMLCTFQFLRSSPGELSPTCLGHLLAILCIPCNYLFSPVSLFSLLCASRNGLFPKTTWTQIWFKVF